MRSPQVRGRDNQAPGYDRISQAHLHNQQGGNELIILPSVIRQTHHSYIQYFWWLLTCDILYVCSTKISYTYFAYNRILDRQTEWGWIESDRTGVSHGEYSRWWMRVKEIGAVGLFCTDIYWLCVCVCVIPPYSGLTPSLATVLFSNLKWMNNFSNRHDLPYTLFEMT